MSFIFFMDFTVRELFHPDNKEKHVTHAQRSVFDRPIMMVSLRLENPVFHVCICKTISENFHFPISNDRILDKLNLFGLNKFD